MKNKLFIVCAFMFYMNGFAQTVYITDKTTLDTNSPTKIKLNPTYFQFDATVALKGNPNAGQTDPYTNEKENWFLPDGLGAKFGYGLHYNKWISLGIHTGINWEWTEKLVVAPVFMNFKLSPKIGEEARLVLQTGFGKAIALGRGDLSGNYTKLSLGLQIDELLFSIEANLYDFQLNKYRNSGNISIGLTLISY